MRKAQIETQTGRLADPLDREHIISLGKTYQKPAASTDSKTDIESVTGGHMFELIFIFVLLFYFVLTGLAALSAFSIFPTLLLALISVPPLVFLWGKHLSRRYFCQALFENPHRAPVPPELFYRYVFQSKIKKTLLLGIIGSVIAWIFVFRFPMLKSGLELLGHQLTFGGRPNFANTQIATSLLTVAAAFSAVLLTARTIGYAVLAWKASRRFDGWAASFVRKYRKILYRVSDDPEFYDPERVPLPEPHEHKDTVY